MLGGNNIFPSLVLPSGERIAANTSRVALVAIDSEIKGVVSVSIASAPALNIYSSSCSPFNSPSIILSSTANTGSLIVLYESKYLVDTFVISPFSFLFQIKLLFFSYLPSANFV